MLLLSNLPAAAGAPAAESRYVASRRVVLAYAAANDAPVEQIDVWVTRDGGKTWNTAAVERCGRQAVCYAAPEDGWYGFYLVLKNAAGVSADPPAGGAEPHTRIVVDTQPPTLQLHTGPEPVRITPGEPFRMRLSLIDEHLGSRPVRVFYRTDAAAAWVNGGPAMVDGVEMSWPVPRNVPEQLDLRVVATDRAGNRAVEDRANVTSRPPAQVTDTNPVPAPETQLAADISPAPQPPPAVDLERLNQLRRQAALEMAQGRYPQAAETLEQAAGVSPSEPDLLTDLGESLYAAGRHDDADRRFAAAVAAAPDHTRALEGLALVAATQKRYSQAAAHLEHLLRLKPESAETWLHYGDVEHKLGDRSRALEAWGRVLNLRDSEPAVRESAERRLKYFGPPGRVQP